VSIKHFLALDCIDLQIVWFDMQIGQLDDTVSSIVKLKSTMHNVIKCVLYTVKINK